MKNYETLLALTSDERSSELKTSYTSVATLNTSKGELQKLAAKLLVSMAGAGDCKKGAYRKHAMKITGADIREEMQDIYGLIAVFDAVLADEIGITEEEFDSMESSKLALLSPFLSKEELQPFLDEAVKAAKTGTAKDIRDLKPKKDKDEPEATKPAPEPIAFGFIATDIDKDAPLVTSAQAKSRLQADFLKACETEDDTSLITMMNVFGRMLISTAAAMECDPKEFLDELSSEAAKPAAGAVVEVAGALVAA
jgi:hypothetical protein